MFRYCSFLLWAPCAEGWTEMPCNGYNHRPECTCPFGNSGGSSDRTALSGPRSTRRGPGVKQSQPRTCRCGMTVYGVWPRGRGFFWAISVDPLVRHTCDYTRRIGRPRIAKSESRTDGWLPFQVETVAPIGDTVRISAFAIPLGNFIIEVEDASGMEFLGTPLFRQANIDDSTVELASRNELSGELMPLQFIGRIVGN